MARNEIYTSHKGQCRGQFCNGKTTHIGYYYKPTLAHLIILLFSLMGAFNREEYL